MTARVATAITGRITSADCISAHLLALPTLANLRDPRAGVGLREMANTLMRNTLFEEKRPTQQTPSLASGHLGMNGRNATRLAVTDLELECALAMATTVLDRA